MLFGRFDMETAFKHMAMAGYDGIAMSAIDNMSEHLVLDRWHDVAPGRIVASAQTDEQGGETKYLWKNAD